LSDWTDVEYLIQWHIANSITLQPGAIPNATVEAFYDSQNWTFITEMDWSAIGGTLPPMKMTRSSTPAKSELLVPESQLKKLKTQQKIEAERQKLLAEEKITARAQREAIIQRTAEYAKEYLNMEKEQIHLKRLAKKEGKFFVAPNQNSSSSFVSKGELPLLSFQTYSLILF
jgi:hypothetical protein